MIIKKTATNSLLHQPNTPYIALTTGAKNPPAEESKGRVEARKSVESARKNIKTEISETTEGGSRSVE
jgi:hypothetical protein